MRLFFNMMGNFSCSPLGQVPGVRFQALCRGLIIGRIPWMLLLLAILTTIAPTAHATVGGTVILPFPVRDSKAGIQMPTVPTGSTVDFSGNIYITGYQRLIGGTSGEDYYTIKITAAGILDAAWGAKSYNEANNDDRATAIIVDTDNNVIVTGTVTMADSSKHIHTIKYKGDTGAVLWEHTYKPTGPTHVSDLATSIVVYNGNVYVTGTSRVSGSDNDDILILKYDNNGSGDNPPVKAVVFDRTGTQDEAVSISAAAGGVAVVGRTWNGTEFDMLTLKYDLNLTDATKKVWQHSSPGGNAAGNNGSWGRFVKVDPDGNVIASGFDISSGTSKDIYTVKYCDNATPANCNGKAQGAMIWDVRYSSNGKYEDDVKDLAVDAAKDVYITGITSPMSSTTDFYTAKYNGVTGALVWEAKTDGGSNIDVPAAIVVDDLGEVYVTGYSKLNGIDAIQTMKYRKNTDTTTGRLLWQRTFKNPDNPPAAGNPDLLDIHGTGIGLSAGGVVVAGWATKLSEPRVDFGSASAGSTTTLQESGRTWTPGQYANYFLKITETNPPDGPNKGQVRPITALPPNTADTLTVATGFPFPAAINAGDSYEIYTVDTDYYALKYEKGTLDRPTDLTATTLSNSSIRLAWSDNSTTETGFKLERCKGKGCDFSVLDAVITITSGTPGSTATITYDDTDATNTANGTPKLDPDNYYYYRVKAYTTAPAEETEYSNSVRGLTVFLNYVTFAPPPSAGVFTYDGTDHQEDTSPAVAVGPDNNPVVTGRSFIAGDNLDYYTIKLKNTDLSTLWEARYDAGQYDNDEATCLAVDKDNNVIVSGDSILPPRDDNNNIIGTNMNVLMTVKYLNPPEVDGFNKPTHSWYKQYNGPGKIDDHATAVATDAAGNFVVVGYGKKDAGNHQYIYVVKYNATTDPTSNPRAWVGPLYDAGVGGKPTAVAFGKNGDIFVTGQRFTGTNFDYFTIRYSGVDGHIIWQDVNTYDSSTDYGNDYARSLAVDANGDVYVTGSAINAQGNRDFFTIKYDGDPAKTTATRIASWQTNSHSTSLSSNGLTSGEAVSIKVDPVSNDVVIAGNTFNDPGNSDFTIARYKSDGTPVNKKVLLRPDNDDYVIAMALDASGNAFVAGNTSIVGGTASMTIQFDADGKVIQSNIYNASTAHEDVTINIAVNSLNEAFVVGTTRRSSIDYLLYKMPVWPVQAPAPVTVTPGYTTLAFSWPATSITATAGVIKYIWKKADGACSDTSNFGAESAPFASTSYTATGLEQGHTYCYAFKTTTTLKGDSRWVPVTVTAATPGAPGPFSATANNTTQITLSGTVNTTGQKSFEIQRCTGTECDFSSLDAGYNPKTITATGSETTITHVDTTGCPDTTYKYRIRALNTDTGYVWSTDYSTASATTAKIPVTAITVSPTTYSESQINLNWNDPTTDETGYEIWRCSESTGCTDFSQIDTVAANTYNSTGLTPNASYRFKVRPYKTAACGWPASFSATTAATPATYTKPVWQTTTFPNTTQANISWTDKTSSESSFALQRCTGTCSTFTPDPDFGGTGVNTKTIAASLDKDNILSSADTSVCTNATYNYRVKPVNNGIQSNSGGGSWGKSAPLTIANFRADFITRVTIKGSANGYAGMKADFSDIRFYDETAKKEIPYWIESQTDTSSAIVWFKTGSSNNIRLYYGNASATSTSNLASVFGSGVMAFFPFNESPTYNNYSYDKSGFGNDVRMYYSTPYGVANPGALKLSPDSGNVMSTDGTNNKYAYRYFLWGTNLPTGGTATIEAWIYPYPTQTNGLYNGIVSFGADAIAQRVYLSLQDNGRPAMLGAGNDFVPSAGTQATFNAWNHIAVVLDGTNKATLYMNGKSDYGTGTLSNGQIPNLQMSAYDILYVGSDRDGRAFNGLIDDVRIYNRALTATDIAMRYASNLPTVTVGTGVASTAFSNLWVDDTTFYSTTLSVPVPAPAAPSGLTATANNEAQVTLTWTNKTSDQTGFKIYRCTGNSCSNFTLIDTVPDISAINSQVTYINKNPQTDNLVTGTTYTYMVRAYKTGAGVCAWDSANSNAPTALMPLNAPSGLYKAYSIAATCKDLRFTDNGGNSIDYWLESGCNTAATSVWLKVPTLTAGANTVYLHYANPSAIAPTTDLGTFFDFYDDFAGTTLNSAKWTKIEPCGSKITQNNGLVVSGGCTSWGSTGMYSNTDIPRPFILEYSHMRTGSSNMYMMFGAKNTTSNIQYGNLVYGIYSIYEGNGRLSVYEDGAYRGDNLKTIASNTWQYYKLEVLPTGANYYHGDSPTAYTKFYPATAPTYSSVSPLKIGMDNYNQAFTLGTVRVRRYASTVPTFTLLAEQYGAFALTGGTWGVKRPITITNATGSTLNNYQMPITIDTIPMAWDQIKLNWTNNTISEDGYIIERCNNTVRGNCATTFVADNSYPIAGNGITTYYDSDIKNNTSYCYRVKAKRTADPAWPTPVTSSVTCDIAHRQTAPVLSATASSTQINLAWNETNSIYISESGTTSATNSTININDTTKSWGTNQWASHYLKMTSGNANNIGVIRRIASNTPNQIVVDAFPNNVLINNSYQILPIDGSGNMISSIIGEHSYEIWKCPGSSCDPKAGAATSTRVATLPYNSSTAYTEQVCTSDDFTYVLRVLKYGSSATPLTFEVDSWPEYSNQITTHTTQVAVPTLVTATTLSETQIKVTWQDNTSNETGFNIYRCKDAGSACSNFTLLAQVLPNTITYTDSKDIAAGSTYRYQVKVTTGGSGGCSAFENIGTPAVTSATTTTAAPALNVVSGNTTQANVTWNDNTTSEGSIVLERCTGVGCTDFSPLSNLSTVAPPAKQNKAFYPFASDVKDTSGSGLNLGRTPVLNDSASTYYDPNFNDGLNLYHSWKDSFQSPVTGILDTDTHAIEFDFMIRQYMSGTRGKVFGYTVATATPDKSSPGIYVPANGSTYGLGWTYLDKSGGSSEIHIGVNGIGDTSGAFTVNQWYHIRGEKSGSKFTVYIDGILKNSTTVVSPQQTGNFPLTFGRDATMDSPAAINLKNFSIDGNVQYADTTECAGNTYSYRTRAIRDGFVSSNVNVANFQADTPTRVVVPASIVAGRSAAQLNDLRFYDYTAKADIPYWVESVLPDGTAVVWIKSANSTITLYANKNATGATNVSSMSGLLGSGASANLVAYWPFNEAVGTTTGAAIADASGNGSTGTLTGGASIVAGGKSGNGLSLNGTSGYLNIPVASGAPLDITGSMSIDFWYYYDSTLADSENTCKPLMNRPYDSADTTRIFNLYLGCTSAVNGTGSATSAGTTTTLTNSAAPFAAVDHFKGSTLKMTSGTAANLNKTTTITANSTTVLTFTAFSGGAAVASGDGYTIISTATDNSANNYTLKNTSSGSNWTTNVFSTSMLTMISGANSGQIRYITNNDTNTLTVYPPFTNPVAAGDQYTLSPYITNSNRTVNFNVGDSSNRQFRADYGGPLPPLANNAWNHIVAKYDDTNKKISVTVNGVESNPNTVPGTYTSLSTSSKPIKIGTTSNLNAFHKGTIDEVRIYNRALNSATVDTAAAFPTSFTAWKASTPVLIANFQPNYQTRLTVAKSAQMKNDFSDLRFYDTTAQAELPYWIESPITGNPTTATLWLKTGNTNTIAMYYGNSSAASASNGAATFDFFDDFTTLDVSDPSLLGNDNGSHKWSRSIQSKGITKGTAAATGNSTTTLNVDTTNTTSGTWTGNFYADPSGVNCGSGTYDVEDNYCYLLMLSGNNIGKSRRITAQTDALLGTDAFPADIGPGDKFQIIFNPNIVQRVATVSTPDSSSVKIETGSLYSNAPVVSGTQNQVFEMKSKWLNVANSYSGFALANALGTYGSNVGAHALGYFMSNSTDTGATNPLLVWAADGTAAAYNVIGGATVYDALFDDVIVGYEFKGTNPLSFYVKNTNYTELNRIVGTGTWNQAPYIKLGYYSGANGGLANGDDIQVDWVRVRKSAGASPEPQATVNTGQIPTSLNPGSGGSVIWTAGSPLTINNFQPNFQTRLTVNYITGMKTDFSDLRFYDSIANVEVPYWIERYDASSIATVWLKTGVNNSITMYYGNPGATSTGNAANVFEFFEDFTTLDVSVPTANGNDPASHRWSRSVKNMAIVKGTAAATGNSTTSLQDDGTSNAGVWTANYYNNYYLLIMSVTDPSRSANSGQFRRITASSTGKLISTDPAYPFPFAIGTGDTYQIIYDPTVTANVSDAVVTSGALNFITGAIYSNTPVLSTSPVGYVFEMKNKMTNNGTFASAALTVSNSQFATSGNGNTAGYAERYFAHADLRVSASGLQAVAANGVTKNWNASPLLLNTGTGTSDANFTGRDLISGIDFKGASDLYYYSRDAASYSTVYSKSINTLDSTLWTANTSTSVWAPTYPYASAIAPYVFIGHVWGENGAIGAGTPLNVDWLRVRKSASPEPLASVGTANQAPAPDIYQFLNNWATPYSNTVTITTPQVANIATNSEFENGMINWTVGAGASEDATTAASGLKSLKISKSLTASTSELASLPLPQLLPGGSYTLSGNIKANLTNGTAFCRLAVNNATWDNPGVGFPEYDIYNSPVFTWNKTNNTIPDSSNSSSTDGRLPLGISTGGAGLTTSPFGTPTDKGDTGSVQGTAIIKESASSYRMWYSGSEHGTAGSWRVYSATSTNGIDWSKGDTTLPPIQDTGVVPTNNSGRLGLGTDVAGIGDRLHVFVSSAVIKDAEEADANKRYKMWYSGHDRSYWRIYMATSPDGLNWTKLNNSVQAVASDCAANSGGCTDGRIALGATGNDTKGTFAPTVVKDPNAVAAERYKMWYSGNDGTYWRIFYATSPDGLTWTKKNNVATAARDLTPPPANENSGQIPLGSNGKGDDYYTYMPHVVWEGGTTFKMWYSGYNVLDYPIPSPRMYRVLHAISTDGGLNWTKQNNSVIAASDSVSNSSQVTTGTALRGDAIGALAPFVLKESTNVYTMWYSGVASGNSASIYRATTTNNGSSWTKQDNTVPARSGSSGTNGRIPLGTTPLTGDTYNVSPGSVIKDVDEADANKRYKMWYAGSEGAAWRIYHATSADGLAWNKLDQTMPDLLDTTGSSSNGRLPVGSIGNGDSGGVITPNVVKDTDAIPAERYKMWYSATDNFVWRGIFRATSPDGLAWTKTNNATFATTHDTGTDAAPGAPGGGRLFLGSSTKGDNRQVRLGSGSVIWDGGQNYKMWYSGNNGNWRIYYAYSTDGGKTWIKKNNDVPTASDLTGTDGRIPLGTGSSGDNTHAAFPTVYREDANNYKMWYSGTNGSGIWRIFYATSTDGGLTWTKQNNTLPAEPSDSSSSFGRLALGSAGKGDFTHIQLAFVLKDNGKYRMWYHGFDQSFQQRQRIYHAIQGDNLVSQNDNQWHSFSLPITLKSTLSAADATNLRILCGISRYGGTDGLTDTANFDMLQLVPNNLAAFNLTATKASESRIDLAWSDMTTDETGYKIWRCKDPNQTTACTDFGTSPFATVAAGITSYQDTANLQPNTTYRYKVGAFKTTPGTCNGGWESSYSNIAFATTDDAAPASLKANAINTNQVDLSWTDKSLGESGFAIERGTDGTTFTQLPTLAAINATTFSDMTACASTTYTYRVRALNKGLSLDGGLGNNCGTTPSNGWYKRKHLNITGWQPQYQTTLTVTFVAGMKADFSDLRFFDATVGKELPYWIESIAGTPATATVWLETGDNNNIDMYYGNTNAANVSNPGKVFDFYDDFTGSAVDAAKWTVIDASGLSVSGGNLHGTNTSGQIKSIATFPAGKTLEYKAKATKWADNPWYVGGFSAPSKYLGWVAFNNKWQDVFKPNNTSGRDFNYYTSGGTSSVDLSTNFPSKSDILSTNNMLYRVTAKDAGNMAVHIDALDRLDAQGKPLVLTDVANDTFTYADAPIVIGGSVANPGEAMQVDWDWVRVRKFAANEPAVTLDSEVVSSSLTPSQICFSFPNQWGDEDAGTRYYSSNSNPVKTPTPFAPSNVTAYEVTPTRIDLSWADNTGSEETGFEIQDCGANCTNTSAVPVAVAANTTKYSLTSLTAGSTHCYRVRAAKNGAACGWPTDYSPAACVTLSNTIHLDATAQGPFAVKLDWDNVPNDVRGFEIEKKLVNGSFANIATVGNILTYIDKVGIGQLKSYTYRVRKTGNADNSVSGINTVTWTPEVGHLYRRNDSTAVLTGNVQESPYTVIQDNSVSAGLNKNLWTNDQWLNCPVLISSGGNTIPGKVAGNLNAQFFVSPALTTPVTTSDTYRILNTVSGTAYGGYTYTGTTTQIVDTLKNWVTSQWTTTPHYLKIVSSVNSANMGQIRKIASLANTYTLTVETPFPAAIAAGDTYQVASDFGIATPGSSDTLLKDASKSWNTDLTAGYYLMMTSGSNNGQIRQIIGYTATTLTVAPAFGTPIAVNDSYLIASTGVTGTVSTAVAAGGSKGTAKLSTSGQQVEFSSVSAGVGGNYNYELMIANDLTPFNSDFDMQVDYNLPDGLMNSTSNNTNHYACLRYQFYLLPTATYPYQYQTIICRGKTPITDNGRATSGSTTTITDTRTMAGTTTPWKSWTTDQWKGQYLQMINGSNALLTRKILSNTANSITVESEFPIAIATNNTYRINNIQGTAASSGNTNTLLVDGATAPAKDWGNQWAGFQLKMTSGPNIGQVRTILSNTANTITVSTPFDNPIGNYASGGDSYQIFDTGEATKAKEYYLVSINDAQYNVVEIILFPSVDTSGNFRIARVGDSVMFYNTTAGGDWNLLRQLNLPGSAAVTPTYLYLYQLGSLSEPVGTSMKAQLDDFKLTLLSSHGVVGSSGNNNPYSNEATSVTTSDGNKYVPGTNTILLNTTPAFTAGDGDCTCVVQSNGTTVCTPGRTP